MRELLKFWVKIKGQNKSEEKVIGTEIVGKTNRMGKRGKGLRKRTKIMEFLRNNEKIRKFE